MKYRAFINAAFFVLCIMLCVTMTKGEVPGLISIQGVLTDLSDDVVEDGEYSVVFSIYDVPSGGSPLWAETLSVSTTNGLFTTLLGQTNSITPEIFDLPDRWLGIKVGTDSEMTPRQRITSMPYGHHARYADVSLISEEAAESSVNSTSIQDGSIELIDISQSGAASGQVIKWVGGAWQVANDEVGAGSEGWTDAGSIVSLTTATDSVGIGTSDPRAPLEVQGSVIAIMGESHGTGLSIGVLGGNDSEGIGVMGTSNDGRAVSGLSITGFGGHFSGPKNYISSNLGIGTETPEEMVHMYKNSSGVSNYLKIQSDHASNWGETGLRLTTPQNTWHFRMDDDANNNMPSGGLGLRSHNLDAEVMTWAENGRVGIGTTSPNYPLEVVSSGNTLRARCTGSGIGVYSSSSSGFGVYSDAPENFMGGFTGFGQSSPTHRITVNGAVGIQKNGVTRFHLLYYNSGFSISETNVADYRIYVKDGGNVGIGTSNPTAKLHVAGTFHADAFETDAIGSENVRDEVGIAYASDNTLYEDLTTGWTSYLTKQITIPTAGYILALGSCYTIIDHGITDATGVSFTVSDLPNNPNGGGGFISGIRIGSTVGAGNYHFTMSCQRLLYKSAGTHTFYLISHLTESNEVTIVSPEMALIFLPTAYGSKSGMISTNPADNISISQIDDAENIESARTIRENKQVSESTVDQKNAPLRQLIETLTAKIEALESRMEVVEKE